MGILKRRKNKKYNYQPRYYKGAEDGSPFCMKHKFDSFRTTVGDNKNLKGKLNAALEDLKDTPNTGVNRRVLIIIAVLLFLFLFIIDFDLSIFFKK